MANEATLKVARLALAAAFLPAAAGLAVQPGAARASPTSCIAEQKALTQVTADG